MAYSMKTLLCLFAVALLCVCCVGLCYHTNETFCFCVVPETSPEIPPEDTCRSCEERKCPCGTLEHFISDGSFGKNYSTFYFIAGNYTLGRVANVTEGVHNLTLISSGSSKLYASRPGATSEPVVRIRCDSDGDSGFYFENVENLAIVDIGFYNCGFSKFGAVMCRLGTNLYISGVEIKYSRGWGLTCENIYGRSLITDTCVSHSKNVMNYTGGNVNLIYDHSVGKRASFNITNSIVSDGINNAYNKKTHRTGYGGGIHMYLKTIDVVDIYIESVWFENNKGDEGGNVALLYRSTQPNRWFSSVTFSHCHFLKGLSRFGGGLFVSMAADVHRDNTLMQTSSNSGAVVTIVDSEISNNSADLVGAGLYLQFLENVALENVSTVTVKNTVFDNNENLATIYSRGGSAVNLINFHVPSYKTHRLIQYKVSFMSCNFTRNRGQANAEDSVGSGTLYVEQNAYMTLRDCLFEDNECTGITAIHSNIVLEGNIVLRNNTAFNGGGMLLCDNSVLFFSLETQVKVTIEYCHAYNFGGGIYAEFECSQASPPCFFQLNTLQGIPPNNLFFLQNNTAMKAGTAIYGGAVDTCFQFESSENIISKSKFFERLFNITPAQQNHLSNISSNPVKICYCDDSGIPQCNERSRYYGSVYPGSTLTVFVVVVGQRDGPVPGIVAASPISMIDKQQSTQRLDSVCKHLSYTISGEPGNDISLNLSIGNSRVISAFDDKGASISIFVTVKRCPLGFEFYPKKHKCICAHWVDQLHSGHSQIICRISSETIKRYSNSTWWLGDSVGKNSSRVATFGVYCPFDYCVRKDISIHVNETDFSDSQCAHHRTGVLCGACKGNRSNVLGSSGCKNCRMPYSAFRIFGLILLFALLGIVFVFLVGILDMTVSEGTLNAMVFYMNVVRVNTSIFFDSPKTPNRVNTLLKVFVAWMNLDLGIETCFYDGMGTINKTALQFVFPLYLCLLSGLIIYLSRKSSIVTNMFGKNVVKILATVIFHLYAKFLRTVINILRVSRIYSEETGGTFTLGNIMLGNVTYVWTVDGNIPYFNKRHTILFAFAVAVIAVTLPYTLVLLFIQCLRRRSNMKVFFWVNKLKPFFDAYTGPYKDNYHFWTGFLLVVRIVLFITIAVNTSKGDILNLTLISSAAAILLVLIQRGIYKSLALNIIEAFTYANISLLVAGTTYDLRFNYTNNFFIIVCVGSMFLLFCGIVVYHILKKLSVTRRWGLMKVWLLDRRWPWMKRKQIRSLILPYVDPDNDEDLSSSDSELDPILRNAPPVARYDQYREPLIGTTMSDGVY